MEIVNIGNVSKDRFRAYSNKLLNECFILKNCEDTRQCYYFIAREKEFQPILNILAMMLSSMKNLASSV